MEGKSYVILGYTNTVEENIELDKKPDNSF